MWFSPVALLPVTLTGSCSVLQDEHVYDQDYLDVRGLLYGVK